MPLQLTEGKYFGDTVTSKEFSFFTCSLTRYRSHEQIQKHYHDNSYVSLLVNGHYTESAGSDDEIRAGQAIFRPVDYSHSNHFQGSGGACLNIELRQGFREQIDFPLRLPANAHIYPAGAFPALHKLLLCLRHEMDEDLVQEMALSWLQEISQDAVPLSSLPWIPKVKQILEQETDVHHTIHSLSERVFVHPVYLARAFKEKTGFTPGEYQLRKRLQKAIQLLLRSSLSITDIAYTAGFFDPSHLVRSFRLFYGQSPRQFRETLKS